jgi:transposase
VRLEAVPWARPGAAHTRDFEDLVAWLAQQMAFAPIARLLRVGWHTIGPIVARVVADHLDERRLEGLVAIGVDEISCAPRGANQPGWVRGPPAGRRNGRLKLGAA